MTNIAADNTQEVANWLSFGYLRLTLVHSKGPSQGDANCDCVILSRKQCMCVLCVCVCVCVCECVCV